MESRHPNLVKIGKNIQDIRKARGFSQEALADTALFGRTYVGRVERGEQNISVQNLIQLALVLEVEVGDFLPSTKELLSPKAG